MWEASLLDSQFPCFWPLCLLWHKRGCVGLIIVDSCLRRSLTVTRHQGQQVLQCSQLPRSDVTLCYSWRNPPEERLSASARLWCGTALWLPWIHCTVCLWNLPRHTECLVDYQNTWNDFLHSAKYLWSMFSASVLCHEKQQSTKDTWAGK